jgi:anti-sigma28 factor (negative regulator of flagellin synthesis)
MRLQLDSSQLSNIDARPADAVADTGQSARSAYGRISGGAGDSISLSGASSAFSKSSAERAARIQQLTAAVQSGSYRVPAAAISSAIVRNGLA